MVNLLLGSDLTRKAAGMERYWLETNTKLHCTEDSARKYGSDYTAPDGWHEVVLAADAQRALDAEREKVKRLSTCGTDHSTPWWQVKCEDLEAQLATLQAQLRQVEGQSKQQAEEAVIVFAKYTTLRQLVEALLTELDDATYVDTDGHRYATYREDVELGNLDTVIKHARATLAARDDGNH